MKMKLPHAGDTSGFVPWVIEHHRIVYLLTGFLVLLGCIGIFRMDKDEFPNVKIKQGLVVGVYPGASPAEVEDQLTAPLEEILLQVPEVKRGNLRSESCDGRCYIFADIDCPDSRKDEVWSKIKQKVSEGKMNLPAGVLAVVVLDDFNAVSTLLVSVESEDKGYSELKDLTDGLCNSLRRLDKLKSVSVLGAQQEEIAVTVDRERLSQYGIDPALLLVQLQSASIALPSGTFESSLTQAPIYIDGTVQSEKDVYDKIIYATPDGQTVRLGDVSRIERRYKSPEDFIEFNGHPCLILSIEMKSGTNIVDFGRDVDGVLAEFEQESPSSVRVSRIADQPKVVSHSVTSFLRDMVLAMVIVILVMMLLFPMRSALIAGSGVPLCTLITIAVMYICHMPLHTVTLAALIVVLGMIVDNTIIVIDGYMLKLTEGLPRREAASESIREIFLPTLAATLAISAMFFPMLLILKDPMMIEFVKYFPPVVAFALLISLVYAVTVVPSLEVRFITSGSAGSENFISRIQNALFKLLDKGYRKAEGFCFRHPRATILCGLGAVALGVWMFTTLNIQLFPKADRDFFAVEVELENGNGLDRTKAVSDSLTQMLLADRRVESVTSFIGTGAPRFSATYAPILPSKRSAQLIVNTVSQKATRELIQELDDSHEFDFPQALVHFKQIDYQPVEAPVVITLKGEDRALVEPQAARIREYLSSLGTDVKWAHTASNDYGPQIRIRLRNEDAARLGVNKAALALSLAGTYAGETLGTLWEGEDGIPVNLYTEGVDDRMDYADIGSQMVPTTLPGVNVPLREVADVRFDWSPSFLERRSGEETITISCDMKTGKSQPDVMRKMKKFIRDEIEPTLPDGYVVEYGGLDELNAMIMPDVYKCLLAAIFVLFIFMLFHFKKISLSILTLVLSSLCLFGAFFGLWINKTDFGITAVLGMISLVGIIVRNGILMFEYAEELRKRDGVSVKTAAMTAGARRMRPIFLTSCTTALGVVPMVIGGDLLWQPMGIVILFGTLLSIILIVLVMPVSYWQMYKAEDKK
ncbi:MAG: efflux RND transporter permease subunit [Bacteroidales bacterium]|nr:efflux RND transporter permease subunit [Bacteroidales bacterium]